MTTDLIMRVNVRTTTTTTRVLRLLTSHKCEVWSEGRLVVVAVKDVRMRHFDPLTDIFFSNSFTLTDVKLLGSSVDSPFDRRLFSNKLP